MEQAIEQVRRRLERAAAALATAGVRYAVVGGNAVAAWVSRVEPAAVRNTRDVDILLRRADFEKAKSAMEAAGFVHRRVASLGKGGTMDVFLDGPEAKVRDAVRIFLAGEQTAPELGCTETAENFELIPLVDLLWMKLTSFRDKDRMHLRDLAGVGLVDESWLARFPAALAERLRAILDDPEG